MYGGGGGVEISVGVYLLIGSLVSHVWVSKSGQRWLRKKLLVAYSVPGHYPHQYWLIVSWTLWNKLTWSEIQNFSLTKMHLKMSSAIVLKCGDLWSGAPHTLPSYPIPCGTQLSFPLIWSDLQNSVVNNMIIAEAPKTIYLIRIFVWKYLQNFIQTWMSQLLWTCIRFCQTFFELHCLFHASWDRNDIEKKKRALSR